MIDFSSLTSEIEKAGIITIYRHVHPDCDALGSQYGLYTWLKENYPEKKVYALGQETTDQYPFPSSDQVDDETVRKSLAIVLDTADRPRADDQRFLMANRLIKIDHHPDVDHFGDISIVHPECAAASEILTEYFKGRKDKTVSEKTAEYLYAGILTDTLSYSTSNTTAHTLEMGSFLAEQGIDIPAINRTLFDKSIHDFKFGSFIRSRIQVYKDHIAYVVVSKEELDQWHIDGSKARTYVTEMGHVKEFEAWAIFTESKDQPGIYDGSLRSKTVPVNTIAAGYHGGGHRNASGVKNLSANDIQAIIDNIYTLLAQN